MVAAASIPPIGHAPRARRPDGAGRHVGCIDAGATQLFARRGGCIYVQTVFSAGSGGSAIVLLSS